MITVRQVLTHTAGLHRCAMMVDQATRTLDWDYMVDALARAAPVYPPGTSTGYHAITYGYLVGELVRRVAGQPIDAFVRDEIAIPLGLDGLYVGCPPEERHRISPLEPSMPRLSAPVAAVVRVVGGPVSRVLPLFGLPPINLRRLASVSPRGMEDVMYGPEIMDAVIPSINGFFTARSLAAMYAMLAGKGQLGGVRLMSARTVERLSEVQVDQPDRILMLPMQWRLGYHRVATTHGPVSGAFGHFGFCGSGGWAHPGYDLAVAMVCNRGGGTPSAMSV